MSTSLLLPPRHLEPVRPPAAPDRPTRRAPGLTVLWDPATALPLAGPLLRAGPALALVPAPADPDAALEATVAAGFSPQAVETVPRDGLHARLRALAEEEVTCLVVAGAGAREARALARAIAAAVLVVPERPMPAGGPAVFDAGHMTQTVAAAARCLAADAAEPVVAPEPDALITVARARDGIAVVADAGGWRAPRALRTALRERRPALLV
jgi:hypothetical protein